jgi:hypothetical protein
MVGLFRPQIHSFLLISSRRVGPDGPWAFFNIGILDAPYEDFRAFPALSLSVILLPLTADFCNGSRRSDPACMARGSTYQGEKQPWQPGLSQSWKAEGETDVLRLTGLQTLSNENRTMSEQPYGTDWITLNMSDDSPGRAIPISPQTVAGTDSKTFFMALFGLSNEAFTLAGRESTSFQSRWSDGQKSLLGASLSYTAGCFARGWPASLVLGGYDSTRFDPTTTLEINLRNNTSLTDTNQFTVNVTAITIMFDRTISSDNNDDNPQDVPVNVEAGMTVNIDPVTPQIWLPQSACDAFERAFRLQWDDNASLYFVNQSTHDWLLQTNQSVMFSLSSSRSNSVVQNYTLPYRTVFDLNITYPYVDSWSYYFPLKRGSRPNQYVLGRAFLQETHISVDYDGGYFNLSQATPGSDQKNFVAITPKPDVPNRSSRLAPGVYVGIGAGASIFVIAVGLLALSWTKKWWPFKKATSQKASKTYEGKAELHHDEILRAEAMDRQLVELTAEKERGELETTEKERAELETTGRERAELETTEPTHEVACSIDLNEVHELDASLHNHSMLGNRN